MAGGGDFKIQISKFRFRTLCWRTIPGWKWTRWAARRASIPRVLRRWTERGRPAREFRRQHARRGQQRQIAAVAQGCPVGKTHGAVPLRHRAGAAEIDSRERSPHFALRKLYDGVCEGRIVFAPRGKNGFGYDPLFVPAGFEQTFAELGNDVKNQLSHRAKALEKLKEFFTVMKPAS